MTFAVRYPHRLADLRACGADLALNAQWACHLWDKLEKFSADEIFSILNEQEKKFWVRCRSAEAPPINEKNEERELYAIQRMLNVLQTSSHTDSVAAALRQGPTDPRQKHNIAVSSFTNKKGVFFDAPFVFIPHFDLVSELEYLS